MSDGGWLLAALALPLGYVGAVTLGVAVLTAYAGVVARSEPQDALQARCFAEVRPGLARRLGWLLGEGLLQSVAFVLQAVHRLRFRPRVDLPAGEGGTPVLLVPGYLENPGTLYVLGHRLRRAGFRVVPVDLPSTLRRVADNARWLREAIAAVRDATGAREVAIVGHSMGGVVGRALLHADPSPPVSVVVSIASPHRGTRVAPLGPGGSARDMTPGSAHLQAHPPERTTSVPIHCLAAPQEDIVAPPWSAVLPEGENHVLEAPTGHVGPLFLPSVARRVVDWLDAAGVVRAAAAAPRERLTP